MAYGRPANVRSHRRGVRIRRRRVAPWISVTLVSMLVLAGLGFGYHQLLAQTCSGQQTARVLSAPATAGMLSSFATEWAQREPATADGTCARVVVQSQDSAEVATALAAGWEGDGDDLPHVWVPASTAWVQKAAASELAEPVLPDLLPSIARTPAVLAMPEPMALSLDWPDTQLEDGSPLRWESLLEAFGERDPDWDRLGQPEWGAFRFGMSNPARDTAALLALSAMLDPDETGEVSQAELESAFTLHQLLDAEIYHETTEQLLNSLREADQAEGEAAAAEYVSAFPALEQDVLEYNRGNPATPLAALYPSNGGMEADYPYLILEADWVEPAAREVAELFLAYVRSEGPQQALRAAGFRGTNREAGEDFTEEYGLVSQLEVLPRAVLAPESVTLAIDRWTALTEPSNVLLAVDVSQPMAQLVPGTGQTRLARAAAAVAETVALFTDDDQVGFWDFATALDGDLDYRSLVPLGTLGDVMEDGRSRRTHILEAVNTRQLAQGDTGLYQTIQAAHDTVLGNYEPEAINLVVVVTGGRDGTGEQAGLPLSELLDYLEQAPADGERVPVVTVTFGEEADQEAMQEIAAATGGEAYHSPDGFELEELLRTAVFSAGE